MYDLTLHGQGVPCPPETPNCLEALKPDKSPFFVQKVQGFNSLSISSQIIWYPETGLLLHPPSAITHSFPPRNPSFHQPDLHPSTLAQTSVPSCLSLPGASVTASERGWLIPLVN